MFHANSFIKNRWTEQEWPSSRKSVGVSTFSSEDTNSRRSERAFKLISWRQWFKKLSQVRGESKYTQWFKKTSFLVNATTHYSCQSTRIPCFSQKASDQDRTMNNDPSHRCCTVWHIKGVYGRWSYCFNSVYIPFSCTKNRLHQKTDLRIITSKTHEQFFHLKSVHY